MSRAGHGPCCRTRTTEATRRSARIALITASISRGRGTYRALVARRVRVAVELGYRILQVDASDGSRPLLERLGLSVVGGTTPYILGRDDDQHAHLAKSASRRRPRSAD